SRRVQLTGMAQASLLEGFDTSPTGDVSLLANADASLLQPDNPSPGAVPDGRACSWCRRAIPAKARPDSIFCGRRCRQAAFRIRRRHLVEAQNAQPKRMAYADP